ncbi:hypothetical protein PGT21_035250 [Puccinia graminis f. sp. tritici]|uniref:Uncharacterized protein n=1 Tax=Puccinia graminis f. sp. tritici TaxID=56615 RepID=A0A5B0M8X3_PUCGR|nr:hypothetical protein PGTUg99_024400 [Puccinia graminis f. sp. tritici]KAA1084770.1 hypothetical protein PGT21_035250 [Puccinia graminis f. sp. tritici]
MSVASFLGTASSDFFTQINPPPFLSLGVTINHQGDFHNPNAHRLFQSPSSVHLSSSIDNLVWSSQSRDHVPHHRSPQDDLTTAHHFSV